MSKPRTMSEKTRAFLALRGETFPHVGERGFGHFTEDIKQGILTYFKVEVIRLSASGRTVWVRFVENEGLGDETRWSFYRRDAVHTQYARRRGWDTVTFDRASRYK